METANRKAKERVRYKYLTFAESSFFTSLFNVLGSDLASRLVDGTIGDLVSHGRFDLIFARSEPLRVRLLNLELVLSYAFAEAVAETDMPARVASRQVHGRGCRGILLRNALTTGCDNKVCPSCYSNLIMDLHNGVSTAWTPSHSIITTTLSNPVVVSKVEQEFTQAARKSMSDPASATTHLCAYQGKVPHAIELNGKMCAGYSLVSVVRNDRVNEYIDTVELHGRYDIGRAMVFKDCSGPYIEACFKYPLGLLYPENKGLLEQFLIHSGAARKMFIHYAEEERV